MTVKDAEVATAFEDFMRAFEEYKATNDGRLEVIERRASPDILTEEKLARLDDALDLAKRRLDDIALKAARPAIGRDERAAGADRRAQGGLRRSMSAPAKRPG